MQIHVHTDTCTCMSAPIEVRGQPWACVLAFYLVQGRISCRLPLCVPGCLAQGLLCILMSLLPSCCKEHWVTDGCHCVQLVCILGIPARVLRHAQQALYPPSHLPSLLLGIFSLFSNHSTSLYQQITWHPLKNLEQGTGGLLRSLVPL